ncbi:MAG TPA: homoserine dehydrogenase [Spirochaetota bacterium]|nr:homoserine dehydrogenase [Spirochaetota bacterium]HPI89948.1 homoserine dehydrogenase [Spirochaetota bacterium]HPR48453.1 homoserine dehydrogenase [Spirochaetota bacterium]
MKKVTIGLIGFGTVGSGLYTLLKKNAPLIAMRKGISVEIKTICDLRKSFVQQSTENVTVTDTWQDITGDPEIDIVVELIGGIEPARTIIISALEKNKSVVTANKKLLAEKGAELFAATGKNGSKLGFEAAVGGGIPCILALKQGMTGNNIKSIMGILNGTTNYILTKMDETHKPYEEALKEAQEKGFAEADPTADVEGFDAGHKISLLAAIAYGKAVDYASVLVEGISCINEIDLSYARDMGYVIKLLGIAKECDGALDIRVHPTMIPSTHPLASVRNEFNAIMYDGDMTDPVILYGKGAGSLPTASAVLSDIIQITEKRDIEEKALFTSGEADFIRPENRLSRYYLRIHSHDRPGILSKISGVLGSHNISIASVIQRENVGDDEYIPLIIMTHLSQEKNLLAAAEEINNFSFVGKKVIVIRVEDSLQTGEK